MYKLEMHLHTEGQSPCAQVDCKTIAKLYSENGYNGIVCTNHFNRFLCENYYLKGSETANVEHYLNGYYTLKNECEKFGIDVFFGMELQPDCISYYLPESQSAELLIYGVNPEWVIKEKYNLFNLSVKEVSQICKKNNWILSHAHPYRPFIDVQDYNLLEGCEVYNGNPNNENNNHLAMEFGLKHNLLFTAGSDFHNDYGIGAGVMLKNAVKNNEELVKELRKREHTIFKNSTP